MKKVSLLIILILTTSTIGYFVGESQGKAQAYDYINNRNIETLKSELKRKESEGLLSKIKVDNPDAGRSPIKEAIINGLLGFFLGFKIPFIGEQGVGKGISGEISIVLPTTCCTYPNGVPPCQPSELFPRDTLTYDLYIIDRAGNESNRITTEPIYLRCE